MVAFWSGSGWAGPFCCGVDTTPTGRKLVPGYVMRHVMLSVAEADRLYSPDKATRMAARRDLAAKYHWWRDDAAEYYVDGQPYPG